MAVNDTYVNETQGLADTGTTAFDGSAAGTGAIIATELGGTGDANVYRETDPAGDGSWAVSVQIDSVTGEWHTQLNNFPCNGTGGVRLKIENVSGGSINVFVVGKETDA